MKRPFHSILFLLLAVSVRATPLNVTGVQVSNRQYGTPAALRIYSAGFAGTLIPTGAANPVASAQNEQAVRTGVNVAGRATAGTGSSADPWKGWESAVTSAQNGVVHFPDGWYATSTGLNLYNRRNVRYTGGWGVVIKYTGPTGAGSAVVTFRADAGEPTLPSSNIGIDFSGFIIEGGGAEYGLLLKSIGFNVFRNVRVRNVGGAALRGEGIVGNTFENFQFMSDSDRPDTTGFARMTTRPDYGVHLLHSSAANSQANTFVSVTIDGTTDTGIYLERANLTTFVGGTSEGTSPRAFRIGANSVWNVLKSIDLELSAGAAATTLLVEGGNNTFDSILSTGIAEIASGARNNKLWGGTYHIIRLKSGSYDTQLMGVQYNLNGGAGLDDETDGGSTVIVSPASDYASPTKAQQNIGKLRAGFAHVKGVATHTATPYHGGYVVDGTCDLTLPPQASWVSNIVFVKNLYQGGAADTVTIKVPSGECLNGVTNGTQALTAGQSAILISTGGCWETLAVRN